HISEKNNRPELAFDCLTSAAGKNAAAVLVANQPDGMPWLKIE
ncbi:hypothetical protein MNBD_GAMMA13-988, partial [hydrothermal vent metagenome]